MATRRVTCPVMGCNQTFSRQSDCKRHEDEVHGDPKQCPVLGCTWQNSKRKGRLDAHMKKKHKELYNLQLEVPAGQWDSSQQLATSTYDGQTSYAQTVGASTTTYSNEQPAQTLAAYDQAPQYYQPIIQPSAYTAGGYLEVGNESAGTVAETSYTAADGQVPYDAATNPGNQQYQNNYSW